MLQVLEVQPPDFRELALQTRLRSLIRTLPRGRERPRIHPISPF
jgi:hypothetical protein